MKQGEEKLLKKKLLIERDDFEQLVAMDPEAALKKLRDEVTLHDKFYAKRDPIITDSEYDRLFAKLVELEEKHPQFKDPTSPTQRIIYEPIQNVAKVAHEEPMLSQSKINDQEGIEKFVSQSKSRILAQYKADGISIRLVYQDGILVDAVTRGNGKIGDSIIHIARTIKSIPLKIDATGEVQVRGEIVCPWEEFERVNADGKYANPRSLVSGAVGLLDPGEAAQRGLECVVFDLIKGNVRNIMTGEVVDKVSLQLDWLEKQEFRVIPYRLFENNEQGIQDLMSYCNKIEENRLAIPYMIDGIVLKFNALAIHELLGSTSKTPRWSTAYKFSSMDARTTLQDVVYQVGRTGKLAPVAIYDEITIDGANFTRASLHNMDFIAEKDLHFGDTIMVVRSNDVIPQVTSVVTQDRVKEAVKVEAPDTCPVCGGKVEVIGPDAHCLNDFCEAKLLGRVTHFIKRDAMNIDGMGKKKAEILVEKKYILDVTDIYWLKTYKKQLMEFDGWGEKSVNKLLDSIEESKKQPLSNLLYALGVQHIGRSVSALLAAKFKTMDNLLKAAANSNSFRDTLMSLEGIGEIMASIIAEYFAEEENIERINELKELGLNMEADITEISQDNNVSGKVFVITGKLPSMGRSEAKKLVQANGGKVTGSVSGNTDYLVMGEGAEGSGKHNKAIKLGTTIINEEELYQLMQ